MTEGYFAPQSERQSHVRLEKAQSFLVLTSPEPDADAAENRTDLPRAHAEALLDACPGRLTFERSILRLQGQQALVDRCITPGPLDLVSVEFPSQAEAAAFLPPVWFGDEVTEDDGYANRTMALSGLPNVPETPLSNAALDALLDAVEGHASNAPAERRRRKRESHQDEESTFEMLRRLAVVTPPHSKADVQSPQTGEASGEMLEAKPRRAVLQASADRQNGGDERLAGVIEGLSEALSQTPADQENSAEADLKGRPAWRWSSH